MRNEVDKMMHRVAFEVWTETVFTKYGIVLGYIIIILYALLTIIVKIVLLPFALLFFIYDLLFPRKRPNPDSTNSD